jgi:hypothetical protein
MMSSQRFATEPSSLKSERVWLPGANAHAVHDSLMLQEPVNVLDWTRSITSMDTGIRGRISSDALNDVCELSLTPRSSANFPQTADL